MNSVYFLVHFVNSIFKKIINPSVPEAKRKWQREWRKRLQYRIHCRIDLPFYGPMARWFHTMQLFLSLHSLCDQIMLLWKDIYPIHAGCQLHMLLQNLLCVVIKNVYSISIFLATTRYLKGHVQIRWLFIKILLREFVWISCRWSIKKQTKTIVNMTEQSLIKVFIWKHGHETTRACIGKERSLVALT